MAMGEVGGEQGESMWKKVGKVSERGTDYSVTCVSSLTDMCCEALIFRILVFTLKLL